MPFDKPPALLSSNLGLFSRSHVRQDFSLAGRGMNLDHFIKQKNYPYLAGSLEGKRQA
jgi:hypothetical protein